MRALATVTALIALASAAPAHADGGRITAGVLGGLAAGTIIGATVGAPVYAAPPPVYYAPAPRYYEPPPAYIEESCRVERERFWDGYGWRTRRIQVCD